ncbi:HlyD family secretion protein [Methylocucumis oryzae]|uniref:Transporter n=1 Tax=Methylocucumis oryzae TaxID=1632867 RepID=A0A0F3IKJ1_9GAMM|nr:HlyD family efflux transporter periplasmic adaptor subunit [Methylocucumis oryzae]KJV07043.1 transporter [Methylocucumis oryzae]
MQPTNMRTLTALQFAETACFAHRIARSLVIIFCILLIALAFTPWQQNVRGMGKVIAYTPAERQQTISATVEGRIAYWRVKEGERVKKDQVLAEIVDNDPLYFQRIKSELESYQAKQAANEARVQTFKTQLTMAEQARPNALAAADARINMAKQRLNAAQQSLEATQAAKHTSQLNLTRQQLLQGKGLVSKRSLELAQLEIAQRQADEQRAQAALLAAGSEVQAIQSDKEKLAADTIATIEKTRAELQKAIEDLNAVAGDVFKLQTKLARQHTQTVVAPRDGAIFRLLANPNAEMIKPGQPLAILVPDTQERAVELWVDGNDLPLIVTGSHTRLQFEGYPAIQFGGWPEFSAGSFGGQVVLIDATDDGKGHFRIVIIADSNDIPWPDPRFLRQGVRVNGWVLLGRVTLGYELWRIFNGFPPLVLPEPELTTNSKNDTAAKPDK